MSRYPDEKHSLLFYYLGNQYAKAQQPTKALAAYRQALDLNDQQPWLWQNYAKIAWDLRKYKIAAIALEQADTLKPDVNIYFHAAVANIHAKQGDKALDMLEALIVRAKENSADSWLETYVDQCQQHNDVTRGLVSLQQWKPWLEEHREFWYLLAILHIQAQQYQQAVANLQVLESLGPLNKSRKELMANLLLQVKVPVRSAQLYQQLVDEYPMNQRYMSQLVTAYRLSLQPEKALNIVEKAIRTTPNVKWLKIKGELCFDLNKFKEAFQAFAGVLKLEPKTGSAYLYQGYCALQMDDKALAHTVLTQALNFRKEKKEARRLLDWLHKT
jgi:tetratricopeptide (TPR) repeat protein